MVVAVKDLIFNPQAFFAGKMAEEENLRVPVLILLVVALISGTAAAIVSGATAQMLPAEAASISPILPVIGFVGGIFSVFLIWWLVPAVVFMILSLAFKGTGSFKRILEFVGYGALPQIISGIISLAVIYSYFSSLSLTPVSDPALLAEQITALMKAPILQVAQLTGILFMFWSASIWIFGMKEARHLSTRDAAITVGVPVGIYILYTLFTLWSF
ncbi:MAG: YIP1 family protein [Methanomicrobiaceae archaeon]|nr:YIP1 family protein [Methanomicrobiaceae archaeon]